jgi:hypothetical protein
MAIITRVDIVDMGYDLPGGAALAQEVMERRFTGWIERPRG